MLDDQTQDASMNNAVSSSVQKFRHTFRLFDTQGTGEVGCTQLGKVLRSLGLKPTDMELKEMTSDGSVVVTSDAPSKEMVDLISLRESVDSDEEEFRMSEHTMRAAEKELAYKVLQGRKKQVQAKEKQLWGEKAAAVQEITEQAEVAREELRVYLKSGLSKNEQQRAAEVARIKSEIEQEMRVVDAEFVGEAGGFEEELKELRSHAAAMDQSDDREKEHARLDQLSTDFADRQVGQQAALKEALLLRQKRGVESAQKAFEQECLVLHEHAKEMQAHVDSLQERREGLMHDLKESSKQQRKLNFADFVAAMSGKDCLLQKRLVEQVREFDAAFSVFDRDKQGEISLEDFSKGVVRLGLPWSQEQMVECFREVDEDGGGVMEFTEFSQLMSAPRTELSSALQQKVKEFREAFQMFDLEEDGELSAEDLQKVLWSWGNQISTKEVAGLMLASGADADGSGMIDFCEFVQMFTGPGSSLQRKIKSQVSQFQELFSLIDYQSTGVVTAELLNITLIYFRQQIPFSVLESCITNADTNQSGAISLAEFVRLLSVRGRDNLKGPFAPLDFAQMEKEKRERTLELLQVTSEVESKMFPVGLQLQLSAVDTALPLDRFVSVCSLPARKRTEGELDELASWMKSSCQIPVVSEMSTYQLRELMRHAVLGRFQAGEKIFDVDQEATQIYFILSGHATLNRKAEEGSEFDSLYLPWANLRHEAVHAHICMQSLEFIADTLRTHYPGTGRCVQCTTAMHSACAAAAKWLGRWSSHLATCHTDDTHSVLLSSDSHTTIGTAIQMIEEVWPHIDDACRTVKLMKACNTLLSSHQRIFPHVRRATQSLTVTASTLGAVLARLKNIYKICVTKGASATWREFVDQSDIEDIQEHMDRRRDMMSAIATHDSELDCQSALIQSPILNAGLHVGSIALGRDEAMFGSKLVAGSEWNQDETLCLVLSSENIRRSISVDVQSFFQEKVPDFSRISDEKLGILARHVTKTKISRSELLFRCGKPAEDVYVIESGQIKFMAHPEDMRLRHLAARAAKAKRRHHDDDWGSVDQAKSMFELDSGSLFHTPRENLGLASLMDLAIVGAGSFIEEAKLIRGEWVHTAEAVAISNDVVVYVISKELYDKTVQSRDASKRKNSQLSNMKRTNRASKLIQAQKKMLQDGVEASNGIDLKDLGPCDQGLAKAQRQKISQFKRALNMYDVSVRQTHAQVGFPRQTTVQPTQTTVHPSPPSTQSKPSPFRPRRDRRAPVHVLASTFTGDPAEPPRTPSNFRTGGATSSRTQYTASSLGCRTPGSQTARSHMDSLRMLAVKPEGDIRQRVNQRIHRNAENNLVKAKRELRACMDLVGADSFQRWPVAPHTKAATPSPKPRCSPTQPVQRSPAQPMIVQPAAKKQASSSDLSAVMFPKLRAVRDECVLLDEESC
eukprot:TRINITY_DN12548_c0_g1_i1.p1 TRINITY_DN12548_c0_g1~~TRINITY_DN12548_c0_g1_i1.p1  ORF type:complete len:1418 (+),score=407.99 TRINITY_DN12548_c0_g1_i1:325-4578(+)